MRIGELAGEVGITTEAVRYYEKVDLLAAPTRSSSGYRDYTLPAMQTDLHHLAAVAASAPENVDGAKHCHILEAARPGPRGPNTRGGGQRNRTGMPEGSW